LLFPAVRLACVTPILQCPEQVPFAGYVLPSSPSLCTWLSHAPSTMFDKTPQRPSVTSPFTVRIPTCSASSAMRIHEGLPWISISTPRRTRLLRIPGACHINKITAPCCQEPMGPPELSDLSLPACHGLRTPAGLHILANSDVSVFIFRYVAHYFVFLLPNVNICGSSAECFCWIILS
jgi:hypothetical protein